MRFNEFVEVIRYVFRISKFEALLVFDELKVKDQFQITFNTFVNALQLIITKIAKND